MKVEEYWKTFNEFSGKASEINRQLAFAAIAVIWLFKVDTPAGHRRSAVDDNDGRRTDQITDRRKALCSGS
jgi:hypothetical protein